MNALFFHLKTFSDNTENNISDILSWSNTSITYYILDISNLYHLIVNAK